MLRYKTETRPGLVALYDIRTGNGAGQFLQPRSPHRATILIQDVNNTMAGYQKEILPSTGRLYHQAGRL